MWTFDNLIQSSLILALALVPVLFIARLIEAIFSSRVRKQILKWWWAYILWLALSLMVLGLVFPVSNVGIRAAKEAKTRNMMSQIQIAVLAYQTEYETPPPGKDSATIIRELMSDNHRGIAFLNLKPIHDMNAKGEALDAWSTPLRITLADSQVPIIQSAGPDKKWNTPDDISSQSGGIPSGH